MENCNLRIIRQIFFKNYLIQKLHKNQHVALKWRPLYIASHLNSLALAVRIVWIAADRLVSLRYQPSVSVGVDWGVTTPGACLRSRARERRNEKKGVCVCPVPWGQPSPLKIDRSYNTISVFLVCIVGCSDCGRN